MNFWWQSDISNSKITF